MSDFWDDATAVAPIGDPKSNFWDSADVATTEPTGPSELDSAGRGLAQGASFGLRDEGAGFLKSPSGALKELANKFGTHFSDADLAAYRAERDASRGLDKMAREANPKSFMAGELGGAVATSFIPGLGLAKGAGLAGNIAHAAAQGAAFGAGASEGESLGDLARDTALGGAGGALGGAAGYGAGKLLSGVTTGVGELAGAAAQPLRNTAEDLAINATKATAKQAERFAPGAGGELLDRGFVRFGDSAKNIAKRVGAAADQAGEDVGAAVRALDDKGVKANVTNVVNELEAKIEALRSSPSQADKVRKLQSIVDDIKSTGEFEAVGPHPVQDVPVSEAEFEKRGFNKKIKNWLDPEAGAANKDASSAYRNEVERAALSEQPELAQKFIESKKLSGLLAPIEEATENAANKMGQSSPIGMKDIVVGGFGGFKAAVANKLIAPRLASSGAVTADTLSRIAKQAPQLLGKFAPVIEQAAVRGGQSVAATHFILQQSNQEYRELMKKLQEPDGNEQE